MKWGLRNWCYFQYPRCTTTASVSSTGPTTMTLGCFVLLKVSRQGKRKSSDLTMPLNVFALSRTPHAPGPPISWRVTRICALQAPSFFRNQEPPQPRRSALPRLSRALTCTRRPD